MPDDIRLAISFKDHRKRKKLNMLLKAPRSATDCLIDLWINTAQNHPDGILSGMDAIDLALDAGWTGDPEQFVQALIEAGFLEKTNDGYVLHDWGDHQPYITTSRKRSEQAKLAASTRWEKRKCDEHAVSIEKHADSIEKDANSIEKDANSNAPSPTPSPIPDPSPKTKKQASPGRKQIPEEYIKPIMEVSSQLHSKSNGKKFNPYAFIQKNNRGHPGAILKTLRGLLKQWETTKNPWGYVNAVMKTENQNYNEKDFVRESRAFNKQLAEWSQTDEAKEILSHWKPKALE